MKIRSFDYRDAGAVLDHPAFQQSKADIVEVLTEADVPLLDPSLEPKRGGVKRRQRRALTAKEGPRYFFLPVDQRALNSRLDEAFRARGWQLQPPIVPRGRGTGPETGLKGDYKKERLQVEVQFGNMARWYTDVFKFQLSYSLDEIDVAVLVVPTQGFANMIDENVAYYERVTRELPWAKMSLTLPIWVIGIEPQQNDPIRQVYQQAASIYIAAQASEGRTVSAISFDKRLVEEPVLADEEDQPTPSAHTD